jgi:molecular chaperone HtpG
LPIVTQAPASIFECHLYTRLLETSSAQDGLAERVNAFVAAANPLLDLILAGPFREYTLHNPNHAKKLVHLCEYVIDPTTLEELTALELAVIVMACHLHDLGMCLTSKERSQILSDPKFEAELRNWPQLWDDLMATRALSEKATGPHRLELETRLFQLQEAGLTAFLRPRHATDGRYRALVSQLKEATGRSDLFTVNGVSFQEELIAICMSHNLDVGVLVESSDAYTERFPRALTIGSMHLNVQFCAGILRIVDVMDFDRERTPRILFESLGIEDRDIPGNTVSLREWNKHMAVHSIEIEEEIVVSADSSHPAIERSVRDFCSIIEREIRDTMAVLRKNPEKVLSRYKLQLPVTVRPRVRSLGYVYKDLAFQLDESAISTLLMGEGLYKNKAVAIRELVQNAIDACRVRLIVDHNAEYSPSVAVSEEVDENGRVWLIVKDNGIGMDESILSQFFFRIGTSYYYNSAEFERITRSATESFVPISRFGIGILSVFMMGDRLEVRTRNRFSPRGDKTFRTVRVEGRFGLAFVTEDLDGPKGTTIRVRLCQRSGFEGRVFLSQASAYLRGAVRRPSVPVSVDLFSAPYSLRPATFLSLRDDAAPRLAQSGMVPVVLDFVDAVSRAWTNLPVDNPPPHHDSPIPLPRSYHGLE